MNFPMPNSMTALFSSSLAHIVFVAVLALTFVSVTNKYLDLTEYGQSQFAKALSLKYPDVSLAPPQDQQYLILA